MGAESRLNSFSLKAIADPDVRTNCYNPSNQPLPEALRDVRKSPFGFNIVSQDGSLLTSVSMALPVESGMDRRCESIL